MKLERAPASGACARAWSSSPRNASASPKRRIRRSTGLEACWKERSKYAATPGVEAIAVDQARPRLGGLQVGDPHPLDTVDRGELGQQRLEQAQVAEVLAVGRGVLARPGTARARPARPASGPRRARRRAAARRTSRGRPGSRRRCSAGRSPRPASAAPSARRRDDAARRARAGTPAASARSAGEIGSSRRRSCGVCGCCVSPARIERSCRRCRGSRRSRAPRRPRAATSASSAPYRSARQPTATTAWVAARRP